MRKDPYDDTTALVDREAAAVPTLIQADTITPKPVTWLWRGWLAAGKLHVMAGPPGVGKTTAALAIAAAVSSGGELPDGIAAGQGRVLIWSGEDDPADTIVPRLMANGTDLSRVHFVGNKTDGAPFDPAEDMPRLREALAGLPESPLLLILDPLVSVVAGDSHKNAEVRRSLQPVADLAASAGCAVIGITHFTKGTKGADPVERVCGSIAFGALARVVFGVAKLPDDHADAPGRVLVRAKSNLGEDSGGFRFDVVQAPVPGYPLIEASRVKWQGAITGQAREILAEAESFTDPADRSEIDDAVDWLRKHLSVAPMDRPVAVRLAKNDGIAERTLDRAAKRLPVVSESLGFGKARRWSLPVLPSSRIPVDTEIAGKHGPVGKLGAATGVQRGGDATSATFACLPDGIAAGEDGPDQTRTERQFEEWGRADGDRLAGPNP